MKYCTICKNNEFSRIYARGKSYVHAQVVLYVLPTKKRYVRVGFTATKKIGNAVLRNRARRIMKEALAEHLDPNLQGFDLILVARAQTTKIKSTALSKTVGILFKKAGLPDKKLFSTQQEQEQKTENLDNTSKIK